SAPVIVTAAACGSSRDPETASSRVNGVTNSGSALMLAWPVGTVLATPFTRIVPLVRSEKRGVNLEAVFVVPSIPKSTDPKSTRVAPGPNWVRVIASLFQKMLLNSATGLAKSGRVAAVGYCAVYRGSDCHSGSFASAPRPAERAQVSAGGAGVMHEFSEAPVV